MYVVGVDGSVRSDAALRWALAAARSERCAVLAVRVWYGTGSRDASEIRARNEMERAALSASVARADTNGVAVATELREGDPATELIQAANDTTARALVVGRSGLGGIEATLLGSVSRRCIADAELPVVVVPAATSGDTGRVAVGVTDDEAAREAVAWAADVAAFRGAELVAVHAYEGIAFADDAVTAHYEAELAHRVVAKALERDPDRVPVTYVVTEGRAVNVLLDAARDTDLLVVGARTRGLLAEAVPTTVIRLAEESPVPVAIVHRAAS